MAGGYDPERALPGEEWFRGPCRGGRRSCPKAGRIGDRSARRVQSRRIGWQT